MPQEKKNTLEKGDLWIPSIDTAVYTFSVSNLTRWLLETPAIRYFYLVANVDLCFFFLPGQMHMPQTDWIKSSMLRMEVIFSTVRAA